MLVNSFDRIGEDLDTPTYIIYLEGFDYRKYGTNELKRVEVNDWIHYLLMRQFNISRAEAGKWALERKPNLVITNTKTLIDEVYEYRVLQ